MPRGGETIRSFVKKEVMEHPFSSLAILAVSGAGVSLATHYLEEGWHSGKDWVHDKLQARRGEPVEAVDETERIDEREHCDA